MRLDSVSGPQPLRKMQELARAVEGAGFGGLWLFEGGRTAYLSCAAAALAVDDIDLGTAIALAFPRSPMITAQIAWELAETTGAVFGEVHEDIYAHNPAIFREAMNVLEARGVAGEIDQQLLLNGLGDSGGMPFRLTPGAPGASLETY